MEIKDFLTPSDVLLGIRASDKTQLLEDLCGRAASILKVDADKITADILKREELGSTGLAAAWRSRMPYCRREKTLWPSRSTEECNRVRCHRPPAG
jgi:mannitol/fructose-specific phosphotransferase system IIA component (Ntr-type)